METMVSTALENGRKKLATRRLEQGLARAERERIEQERRLKYFEMFEASINDLFPDGLSQYVEPPARSDAGDLFGHLDFNYPGCATIFVDVHISVDGMVRLNGQQPYNVPGVLTILPYIDSDNDYFPGNICIIYYPGRHDRTDEGVGPEHLSDFELAMALAWERQSYIEQQEELIKELVAELEPARQAIENAKRNAPVKELTYLPVEGDERPENLVNTGELVRLIRGVVEEVLEERDI